MSQSTSHPTSPYSARDARTPGRMRPSMSAQTPTRAEAVQVKREAVEDVFRRYAWTNTTNGTWERGEHTVDIPHVSFLPRGIAKSLMDEARAFGMRCSTPMKSPHRHVHRTPLRDLNGRSPSRPT